MNKTILVTGGCGFIGLNLVSYFLENTDWMITVLDNLSTGHLEHLQQLPSYTSERITFIQGDIRKQQDVNKALQECNTVVHLAAQTDIMTSLADPQQDADINILGTINVLTASVEHDIDRFVFASSAAPLGEQTPPVNETKIPQPLSAYGASKLSGEGYCSAFAATHAFNTIALRFSNVYGPYSYHKGSVIAAFIKAIMNHQQPVIYGDGNQTRDFVHAADIAQAIHRSLTFPLEETYTLYQVGTGIPTTINDLYTMITHVLQEHVLKGKEAVYTPARAGEIYDNYCDISKITHELGFKPQYALEQGIQNTISWFLDQQEALLKKSS